MSVGDVLGVGLGPSGVGAPGAGLVCYPVETFETPLLDFTQVTLGIELVPARPGFIPQNFIASFTVEKISGTQTVPAQVQAGSDAAHLNFYASSAAPPNASVNGNTPPFFSFGLTIAATTVARIPNAPVIFDVTAGAQGTGGFVLLGRIFQTVFWASLG